MSKGNVSSRLQAVRTALAGFPGAPRTQRQITQAMGLDPANFNNMLSGRRPFRPAALARLHQVMRLESLGVELDIEFWTESTDSETAARINAARGGDLADATASRLAASRQRQAI